MFGYLRMYTRNNLPQHQKAYKNYYCGMCFSMQHNYGQLSRFILSYDMMLIGLLLKSHDEPGCDRLPCYGKKSYKQQFSNENWKKVAAVNLLLTAGQLRDNIEDENSFLAKMFIRVFAKKIKQAHLDFPETAKYINIGYDKLLADEKAHKDVKELSADFSSLMENVYCSIMPKNDISEEKVAYIKAVAGWLYFIDQLDDYQKDIDKGRFNPLLKKGFSGHDYINKKFFEIHGLIQHYYQDILNAITQFPQNCVEDELLKNLAIHTIPDMTSKVLNRSKAPKLKHFKEGTVWSDT